MRCILFTSVGGCDYIRSIREIVERVFSLENVFITFCTSIRGILSMDYTLFFAANGNCSLLSSIEFLQHDDYPSLIEFCVRHCQLYTYLPTVLQLPQQTHNTINYGTANIHRETLNRKLCEEEELLWHRLCFRKWEKQWRMVMVTLFLRNWFPNHFTAQYKLKFWSTAASYEWQCQTWYRERRKPSLSSLLDSFRILFSPEVHFKWSI